MKVGVSASLLVLISALVAACGSPATPTQQQISQAIQQSVRATVEAQAAVTPAPTQQQVSRAIRQSVRATVEAQAAVTLVLARQQISQSIEQSVRATVEAWPTVAPPPAATATQQQPPSATGQFVHATAPASASATSAPTPTQEQSPESTAQSIVSQAVTATLVPSATYTPTANGPAAVVQSSVLNVRAGPGTDYPILESANPGDSLPVTGRNQDGSWVQVSPNGGQAGWVSADLVQLSVPVDGLAPVTTLPTPPFAQAGTPTPVTGTDNLEVTFINPHYNCQQVPWTLTGDDGQPYDIWGYRSFQVDMFIKNNGTQPVVPPWQPTLWLIANSNGAPDSISDLMWQWQYSNSGSYQQPIIQPGQVAGWTFSAFPVDENQWVRAVEYVRNGQTYRQDFDLGPLLNNYNYQYCGTEMNHTVRPTPTPGPAALAAAPTTTLAMAPTPGPTWTLLADSTADWPGPFMPRRWFYMWSTGPNDLKWQGIASLGDDGCYDSPYTPVHQICQYSVTTAPGGDVAIQWKAPQNGTYRFEWDSPSLQFYRGQVLIGSQGPGAQLAYSAVVSSGMEQFFWVPEADTNYHIEVFGLQQ